MKKKNSSAAVSSILRPVHGCLMRRLGRFVRANTFQVIAVHFSDYAIDLLSGQQRYVIWIGR